MAQPSLSASPAAPNWDLLNAVAVRMTAASEAFAHEEWAVAATEFRAVADELGDAAEFGGVADQARYNAACALALSGHEEEALGELEQSLSHGYRPVPSRLPDGRTLWRPGLAPAHVLADPDLRPLHSHPRWEAILDRRFRGERAVVEPEAVREGSPRPALVILAAVGATAEASLPPWRIALRDADVLLAAVEGPVRVGEDPVAGAGAWVTTDGDERWGCDAVARVVTRLAARPDVDAGAIRVVAHDASGGRAGWAATMQHPGRVAGVAFLDAPLHRHYHADALAGLAAARGTSEPLIALLLAGRDSEQALLKRFGVDARALVAGADVEATARRITDALGLSSR